MIPACLIRDGDIVAAAQEERFTRKKHDDSFPVEAIKYCLDLEAIEIDDLSAIVFYDKPLLKFERLLETFFLAPKGKIFYSCYACMVKGKNVSKKPIYDELKKLPTQKRM